MVFYKNTSAGKETTAEREIEAETITRNFPLEVKNQVGFHCWNSWTIS